MTNLINPKPRFGFNPATDMVYDYVAQRDVALVDKYAGKDGVWDLLEVKRLILAGETIEGARRNYTPAETAAKPSPKPVPNPGLTPAPLTAQAITKPRGATPDPADPAVHHIPGQAMTPAQLIALRLTAMQAAAMGITPTMMNTTGVTAAQVQGWGLTTARADALKLTAEQRAVLLPGG